MKTMKKSFSKRKAVLALTLCGLLLLVSTVFALTNLTLARGRLAFLDFFNGPVDVIMARITIDPGESSAWHYHPGPVYAVVSKGTLTKESGCGDIEVFSAGQAFTEEP
jgi:hypothetical protein